MTFDFVFLYLSSYASAYLRLALLGTVAALASLAANAQPLPPEVDAALARAKVPREALAAIVVDAAGTTPPQLSWRANASVNPASVMKLVTTYAGLELLGPAYTWPNKNGR